MIYSFVAVAIAITVLAWRSLRHRPRNFGRYYAGFTPTVATHRGFGKMAGVAENTVAAFAASEKLGFRAHELDVRLTRDKKVILLHGPTLAHTTNGTGRAEERTYDEIAALNAAHYLHEAGPQNKHLAHEKVPLLSEVLRKIQKTSIVNVEIKRDRFDFNSQLEPLVDQVVHETGAGARVCYSGFHFLTLWHMKNTGTNSPVGLLIEPGAFARIKCWLYRHLLLPDNIHLHHTTATSGFLKKLKRRGYGIAIWTVNDATRARELFADGADMVITDNMNFVKDFAPARTAKPDKKPALKKRSRR